MKIKAFLKSKWKHGFWVGPLVVGLVSLGMDAYVSRSTNAAVYDTVEAVPAKPVALVLGTSKVTHGRLNRFYDARVRAAAELFKAGKVRGILVSGDNSTTAYDEPTQMKDDLVELGVPEAYITLDYAGFRTLDSVVRANKVFGLSAFIVVSQKFHCQRALFIARHHNIDAVALAADPVSGVWGFKVRVREVLARVNAFLDVYLLGTSPHFLGERKEVPLRL